MNKNPILLWGLLELIDRYAHISNYAEQIRYCIHPSSSDFLKNIEVSLDTQLDRISDLVAKLRSEFTTLPSEILDISIWRKCKDINGNLETKILKGLGSLGVPKPRPEITYFLTGIYKKVEPNISFEPVYDYTAIDYTQAKVGRGGQLISLPLVSSKSPELWIGCAHEIGHFYENKLKNMFLEVIEPHSSDEYWRNWVTEIGCDLFALKTLGPCYFISMISIAVLDVSVYNPLASLAYKYKSNDKTYINPTYFARIEIMKEILDGFVYGEIEEICDRLYNCFDTIHKLEDKDESYKKYIGSDESLDFFNEVRRVEDEILENASEFGKILDEEFPNTFSDFDQFSKDDLELSVNLSSKVIEEEIPIGSIRILEDEDRILAKINKLKTKLEVEGSITKSEVDELWNMFEEESIKMAILFNSFCIVKFKELEELRSKLFSSGFNGSEKNNEEIKDKIRSYKDIVGIRDELHLKSIEISSILRFYKNKRCR